MKRREFLIALGGTAAWPAVARAQRAGRIPKIGVLWHAASEEKQAPFHGWFHQGFVDLGYVAGKTIEFEERYPNEQPERFAALAAELVALKPDVLLALSLPSSLAAQKATSTIPIVFLPVTDPVGMGLVSSLAHPGGNITGLSSMGFDVVPKRVQFFKETVPGLTRIALLLNPSSRYDAERQTSEYAVAARKLQIAVEPIEAKQPSELEGAFAEIKRRGFEGVIISQTPMYFIERDRIAALALQHRLPTLAPADDFVKSGALMSYAAEWRPLYTGAAAYVKRILNGEKPGDIPVMQPTKFERSINLKTAKAIGLDLPEILLARADHVIE